MSNAIYYGWKETALQQREAASMSCIDHQEMNSKYLFISLTVRNHCKSVSLTYCVYRTQDLRG